MMLSKTSHCIISVAILQGLLSTSSNVEAIEPPWMRAMPQTELTGYQPFRQLRGKKKTAETQKSVKKKVGKKSPASTVVADPFPVGLATCNAVNQLEFGGACGCNAADNGFVLECPAICERCIQDSTSCGVSTFRIFYGEEGERYSVFTDFKYTEGRGESVSFGTSFENCEVDITTNTIIEDECDAVSECQFFVDGQACSCNQAADCDDGTTGLLIECDADIGVLDVCASDSITGTVFEAIFPDSGFDNCIAPPVSEADPRASRKSSKKKSLGKKGKSETSEKSEKKTSKKNSLGKKGKKSSSLAPVDPTVTAPSNAPSLMLTTQPSLSGMPSSDPSAGPSISPSLSSKPSSTPSSKPSNTPTSEPSSKPSDMPSSKPMPSSTPSAKPSGAGPSPSTGPSTLPSMQPSETPSSQPSVSSKPTVVPATDPSPSAAPSMLPSMQPSKTQSMIPSTGPSSKPSSMPTPSPSAPPSTMPSFTPSESVVPSTMPSTTPSSTPSESVVPSTTPSTTPSSTPSESAAPSMTPSVSFQPSDSAAPSTIPSSNPSNSAVPSTLPSLGPSVKPV